MVNKAERIRNCGARFFMCLAETFGAHVHHKKKKRKKKNRHLVSFLQKSCTMLCAVNEHSLFTKHANLLGLLKI